MRFCGEPRAVNCSVICRASSRVGVSMSAKVPMGSAAHCWRMGTAKATVLPEPVREPPMQSLPVAVSGGSEVSRETEGLRGGGCERGSE